MRLDRALARELGDAVEVYILDVVELLLKNGRLVKIILDFALAALLKFLKFVFLHATLAFVFLRSHLTILVGIPKLGI